MKQNINYWLTKKKKGTGLKHFNDSEGFIEQSNDMDDIYKNIEEYNLMMTWLLIWLVIKSLIQWTELFIKDRKFKNRSCFYRKLFFAVPKNIRLNSTHYFIMKIPNKRELQRIVYNHSSDIDFKDFMNLNKKCIAKPYSFLVTDGTIASDNPARFRKNL